MFPKNKLIARLPRPQGWWAPALWLFRVRRTGMHDLGAGAEPTAAPVRRSPKPLGHGRYWRLAAVLLATCTLAIGTAPSRCRTR